MEKIKEWKVPQRLTGNLFFFGRPGSGKSCKQLIVAQGLKEKGWKIWDIFGGKREEGPFWAFPNDDYRIWNEIESETNEFRVPGPKQYKVRLLYPMFSKHLKKRLPYCDKNLDIKVFTIPLKDKSMTDDMEQLVSLVTGPMGTTSSRLLDKVISSMDKYTTGRDIKQLFNEKMAKKKDDKLYDMFFKTALANNLLSSEVCELNLDWEAEAQDENTVSVLCLDFVPDKFKFFIMAYILKKIFNLVKANKIPKKNLAIFREASLFMKVVDSDKSKEETTQIFRNIITDIARYCRSGLFLSLDTQDSAEVKGMIEGAEDLMFVNEMPSPRSREMTLEPLKQDKRITQAQISYIGWKIKIHETCIVERGKRAVILKRIHPPRCRYWKSDYGDFFSLWGKEKNTWIETSTFFNKLIKEEDKRDIIVQLNKIEEQSIPPNPQIPQFPILQPQSLPEEEREEEIEEEIEEERESIQKPVIKKEVEYHGTIAEFE